MPTHYTFHIETEAVPTHWIRVEIAADATLHDLHGAIERHFALPASDKYAFFRSGIVGDRRTQFSGDAIESEYYADETPLTRLALRVGAKLAYVADVDTYTAFTLRVESVVNPATKLDAPRLLARGEKPVDPREAVRRELLRRIDAELVQEHDTDEPTEVTVVRTAELARSIYAFVDGDRERLSALSNAGAIDVESWLLDLPTFLSSHGRVEEALELSERGAAVFEPLHFATDRALILAMAGRSAEAQTLARRIIAENLDRPGELWVVIHAALTLHKAGESVEAEALIRRVLDAARDDQETRDDARIALTELLEDLGRADEAAVLLAESRASLDDADTRELARRDAMIADVGRNDPCPCGSEKKFKKCCGAPGATPARTDADCVSDLFVEMFEFVCKSTYVAEFDDAIPRFAGPEFRGLSLHDTVPLLPSDDAFEALLWWFVFDRKLADGTTPADRFFEKRRTTLSTAQRAAFEGMRRSHLSVVRHSIDVDDSGRLEDVLSGEVTRFPDRLPLDGPSAGPIHVVRIMQLSAGPVLAPIVLFTTKAAGAALESRLRANFQALRDRDPKVSIPELLKTHGELVYRDWSDVIAEDAAQATSM